MRRTRTAAAKKVVKAALAKKKASASSSSKRVQTPPSSLPPADANAEVTFDFGSLSPRRKRKAAEEEWRTSKYPPSPQTVLLILICFRLHRDVETLAQRMKRARTSTGG